MDKISLSLASANLEVAASRIEAIIKNMEENLEIARQNLLAAAMELKQPTGTSICIQCGNEKQTSGYEKLCSEDCALAFEQNIQENEATGN